MALVGGFFSNKSLAQQGQKQSEEYIFIPVGKKPLHAVAVALIDALKSPERSSDVTLKKILKCFYHYYPKYASTESYLTLSDRMQLLFNSSRKSELVECMADVLKQLGVDEWYADFLAYLDVFDGLSAETPKNYLRDTEIKTPKRIIDAIAQTLGIDITLSNKGPGKELRQRETFAGANNQGLPAKLHLNIQVQHDSIHGDCYFARVKAKHKADFAYVGQLAVSAPQPAAHASTAEDTLADIVNLVAEEKKQLLRSYDQWHKTILSMVVAGELTCKQLIDLYITFLPNNSTRSTALLALGLAEREPTIAGAPAAVEQQTINLLASALAHGISTKQIEPDKLFDQLERQSAPAVMR